MPNLNVARSIEMLAVGRRALPARCTVDRRCEHHTKNLDGKGRLRDGIVSHKRSLLHLNKAQQIIGALLDRARHENES